MLNIDLTFESSNTSCGNRGAHSHGAPTGTSGGAAAPGTPGGQTGGWACTET